MTEFAGLTYPSPLDEVAFLNASGARDKELELAIAVTQKDFERVHSLLLQGVSRNGLYKGKTLMSVAASEGDVNTMRVLLETIQDDPPPQEPSPAEKNNGYFVVVRDGEDDSDGNGRRRTRTKSEEVTTPEGMADLEWETELEDFSPLQQNKARQEELKSTHQANKVDAQDPRGRCALHYAAEAGQLEAVEYLIESGSKVDVGDRESLTPLHLASVRGHLEVVRYLLNNKAHVNAKCTDKMCPLHYSASRGHVDIVMALISFGASVNTLDSGDRTPLKLAASRDLYQVVKVLVESGAKVNIEDVKGYTALCEAVWQKNVAMARLLLDAGAKLTPTPYLLHYAILHRHAEMVELLLEAGAMVNIRDDHGSTPLIVAAVTAQPSIVKLLLRYGAQVDCSGGLSYKTPLISVLQTDHIPTDLGVVLELIRGGADVDKACWDMTPLNAALCHRKVDAACLLIRYGASVCHRTEGWYQDPMVFARRRGTLSAVQMIVFSGYDLWKNCPQITAYRPGDKTDANSAESWLKMQKFRPLRLSELARIVVRNLWPRQNCMAEYVKSLGLPPLLQRYLMFSDVSLDHGSSNAATSINNNSSTVATETLADFNGLWDHLD